MDFLYLCSKRTKEITVPNKVADFMWHSHMQNNKAYKEDMKNVLGFVLNHMDDIPDDTLKNYNEATQKDRAKHLPQRDHSNGAGGNIG
jgi:hypothetical protein